MVNNILVEFEPSSPPLQPSPEHPGSAHPASALTFAFWRKKKITMATAGVF